MIDLAMLGTGAMMPTADRWLSSVLVRLGNEHMMFDAGEGVQIPWRGQGWGLKPLSLICISHLHADHVTGIPGVLLALANADRTDPVTIIGPKGTRDLVSGLREAVKVLPYDVLVADLHAGASWYWQDLHISVVLGDHRIPVLLYRFDLPRRPAFLVEKAEATGIPRDSRAFFLAASMSRSTDSALPRTNFWVPRAGEYRSESRPIPDQPTPRLGISATPT